jgi:hypothetical protein
MKPGGTQGPVMDEPPDAAAGLAGPATPALPAIMRAHQDPLAAPGPAALAIYGRLASGRGPGPARRAGQHPGAAAAGSPGRNAASRVSGAALPRSAGPACLPGGTARDPLPFQYGCHARAEPRVEQGSPFGCLSLPPAAALHQLGRLPAISSTPVPLGDAQPPGRMNLLTFPVIIDARDARQRPADHARQMVSLELIRAIPHALPQPPVA